jgi:serine/threonine protein kinase
VHRDVSPTNVLMTYDGGVKIVDFGIAKAATARRR